MTRIDDAGRLDGLTILTYDANPLICLFAVIRFIMKFIMRFIMKFVMMSLVTSLMISLMIYRG